MESGELQIVKAPSKDVVRSPNLFKCPDCKAKFKGRIPERHKQSGACDRIRVAASENILRLQSGGQPGEDFCKYCGALMTATRRDNHRWREHWASKRCKKGTAEAIKLNLGLGALEKRQKQGLSTSESTTDQHDNINGVTISNGFSNKFYLRRETLECHDCGKTFSAKRNLTRHLQNGKCPNNPENAIPGTVEIMCAHCNRMFVGSPDAAHRALNLHRAQGLCSKENYTTTSAATSRMQWVQTESSTQVARNPVPVLAFPNPTPISRERFGGQPPHIARKRYGGQPPPIALKRLAGQPPPVARKLFAGQPGGKLAKYKRPLQNRYQKRPKLPEADSPPLVMPWNTCKNCGQVFTGSRNIASRKLKRHTSQTACFKTGSNTEAVSQSAVPTVDNPEPVVTWTGQDYPDALEAPLDNGEVRFLSDMSNWRRLPSSTPNVNNDSTEEASPQPQPDQMNQIEVNSVHEGDDDPSEFSPPQPRQKNPRKRVCLQRGCGQQFKSREDLKIHLRTIHKLNLRECEFCDLWYTHGFALKRHYVKDHKVSKFHGCDLCRLRCPTAASLACHRQVKHGRNDALTLLLRRTENPAIVGARYSESEEEEEGNFDTLEGMYEETMEVEGEDDSYERDVTQDPPPPSQDEDDRQLTNPTGQIGTENMPLVPDWAAPGIVFQIWNADEPN